MMMLRTPLPLLLRSTATLLGASPSTGTHLAVWQQSRGLSWVNRFKSVRTLPLEFGYKKASRFDWDSVRAEVFKDEPADHPYDPAPDGSSRGDMAAPQVTYFIPPADGFPEVQELEEEVATPLQSIIETSKLIRRAADPRPPRLPKVSLHPDGSHHGSGRRKASSAAVFISPGHGLVTVNGKPIHEYFQQWRARDMALSPLVATQHIGFVDIRAVARGGGTYGQAGAMCLALSRALASLTPAFQPVLRASGLIIRDPRAVERKKIGKKKARRAKQWSKR